MTTTLKLWRVLVWLVVMSFVVAGCAADLPRNPAPNVAPGFAPDDDPTTGALVRSTRQAQATVTRQAQLVEEATQVAATATHIAEHQADATAQAIVAAKAAWPLLINEAFTDNQLGWPLGLKQDHSLAVTSTIEAGGYQWVVKVDNGNSYFNLVPAHSLVFTDFVAAVNVKFGPGDEEALVAYGLTFRHVEDDYGFFGITPAGMWQALAVHHTGIYQRVLSSSESIDTRPGKVNRLEVIARGSDFVFFINGQQVGTLSAKIDPGQIGLGVDALQSADTTEVTFTDFEVHAP